MAKPDPCADIAAKAKAASQGKSKAKSHSKALEGVPSWDKFDALKVVDFPTVMKERQAVKAAEDAAIARRKELDATIHSYLIVVDQTAVEWNKHKVQIVPSKAADTISQTKLVEAGVPVDTVVACTIPGKSYEYVLVSAPKEGTDAE